MPKLKNENIKPFIYPLIIALLQCLQLQISSLKTTIYFTACEILSVFILYCMILLVSIAKKKSLQGLECVLMTLFCIANYFTYEYHGGPLFLSTMQSAKTALNVAGGYSYKIDAYIIVILILLIPQIPLARGYIFTGTAKIPVILTIAATIITTIVLQTNPYAWSQQADIAHEGFPVAFIRDLTASSKPIKPKHYKEYDTNRTFVGTERPDIIVILNESYSILDGKDKLTDTDGAITGKMTVPQTGGGTNNSEYELLTSNSMRLYSQDAPFNYLEGNQLRDNTVNYLKSLGYETTAMHCEDPKNYNRDTAYKDMGFDNVYLGDKPWTKNYYGNRPWLDRDNYADMLKWCDFEDKPQFVYLLTYQNHGGYDQNDESCDTVHKTKYGKENDEVNEFMTSVEMSEDALIELINHFKDSDRHTIIIMAGDHNPPFITKIEPDEIKQKQTNYVIWANYDVSLEGGDMTMTDIIPVVLKNAGIGTTDFLGTVYEAHKEYPVRTTNDILISKDEKMSRYNGSQEIVNEYYSKEYNRIK